MSSLQLYPDNRPCSFQNQLAEPLNIKDDGSQWEVALHEIHLNDDFSPSRLPTTGKFFGNYLDDNAFVYTKNDSVSATLQKGNLSVLNAYAQLGKIVKESFKQKKIAFLLDFADPPTPGRTLKIKVKFEDAKPGTYIKFNNHLRNFFNLPKKITDNQQTTYFVNENYFNNEMSSTDDLVVTYVEPIVTRFTIAEPKEFTMRSFMASLETELQTRFKLSIAVDFFKPRDEAQYMELKINQGNVVIQMPRQINEILKLDPKYKFKGVADDTFTKFYVPEDLSHIETTPNWLIVSSNICKPSLIHGKMLPVLRLLPRQPIKTLQTFKCDPVLWQPLESKHLDRISVSILDSSFNQITALKNCTTAILQIRKKWIKT